MARTAQSPRLRVVEPGEGGSWLEQVYRRYAPYVAAVVLRLVGRDTEVDDLVQDVFVEATRGIERLREPEAVKGWLATIAVRVCRRRLSVRRVRLLLGLDAGFDYSTLVDQRRAPSWAWPVATWTARWWCRWSCGAGAPPSTPRRWSAAGRSPGRCGTL